MKLRIAATVFILALSTGCALPFSKTEEASTPVTVEASSITALGRIEPEGAVIRLSVPNAADSRVNEIRVAEGDRVEAGQVIAVLQGAERRQAELQTALALLKQRQAELAKTQKGNVEPASLAAQQAKIARLEAQLSAQANQRRAVVSKSQATLQEAQLAYQRYQQLEAVGAISRSELDTALRDYETARADLTQRQAELSETET
ncbi:MAG TPA: HlyD family secretion protein, partial [Leptolyngbyaceae cyanobacterium]